MINLSTEGRIAVVAFAAETKNLLDAPTIARLDEVVDEIARSDVDAAIVVSDRDEFILGGDLDAILNEENAQASFETTYRLSRVFRRIELSAKPYVAAINATALGGGFELALACHRRIVVDDPAIMLGLPEVKVGLMPGAGGTQRVPRMIGVKAAVPLLLKGSHLSPGEAIELGLVDELVSSQGLRQRAMKAATELAAADDFTKPWDQRGFTLPGGDVQATENRRFFMEQSALAHSRSQGNSIGVRSLLAAVYQGCQAGFDSGLRVEARKFAETASSPGAKATIHARFLDRRRLRKIARTRAVSTPIGKVGVAGLGLMGCGIAYAAASAGSQVVLLDQTEETTAKGRERVMALATKLGNADAVEERLTSAGSAADLSDCDLVIEAVFEDRSLKRDLLCDLEKHISPGTILATNTSSIPISALAEGLQHPERLVGMHFFSPVERMELLEIIPGKDTSDETLNRALDIALRLRKTPIIASDVRGFYTGRVFAPYLAEAFAMIAEGYPPALIENGARRLGMPIGPLALADAVSISLQQALRKQEEADGEGTRRLAQADRVVDLFVDDLGRPGRAAGKGFYDYTADGKRLWNGYGDHFSAASPVPGIELVMDRLLYIQVLDTLRCVEEGTISSPLEADVGAVLGWGFPDHLGGPCLFVDMTGAEAVMKKAEALASQFGERFEPPAILRDLVARDARLHAHQGDAAQ